MPTECERSQTSPTKTSISTITEIKQNLTLPNLNEDITSSHNSATTMEADHQMSTSQTSTTSNGSSTCNGGKKTSITSPDPTAYVAKARVTRPTPPPPPYNPMQFVQIKPCNLYQTAQEQLKKAEEVKKIKEIRKEEPEDWQNNLDNWKSSRRKRVEHIIDRVVEVKKLELEEHDRTRRKSKTFSEMMEERGERSGGRGLNKLASLAVYTEDEANDLSDLGIGTSSASGKSSLSEDYDNNSVMSDNAAELDKAINNSTHNNNNNSSNNKNAITDSTTREYISSPGYETSSSTAPASSPDPCEYTYEGAIQDYKQRVSRAASGLTSVALNKLSSQQQQQQQNSKESTPERPLNKETAYPPRRGSKIEDRLMGFEVQSPSEECVEKNTKVDVPKIDISKRKEIFEAANESEQQPKSQVSTGGAPRVTLRDRFKVQENTEPLTEQPKKELKRLSGDITSIKERLQSLEKQQSLVNDANGAIKTTANKLVDIPVPPLKERLSSLQNAVTKEEVRKPPVVLVDARQLEIMKSEKEKAQMNLKETKKDKDLEKVNEVATKVAETIKMEDAKSSTEVEDIDRDDSGIHTADDVEIEEKVQADIMKKEQELKLNAAIEALAKEEKQLSDAANAVNQIEAEFEELTLGSVALPPLASNQNGATAATQANINNDHMEYSINEALELALEAIDKESITQQTIQQQQQPLQQQLQQQPENSYPITAQYNNNIATATATTKTTTTSAEPSNNISNNNNIINNNNNILNVTEKKTDIRENFDKQQQQQQDSDILLNKTDEEKCKNLKLEESYTSCMEIKQKSEEEISKEPIYENITTTTPTQQEVEQLAETTTTIIPSMMNINETNSSDSNLYNQNQINNLNQNYNENLKQMSTQNSISASNQLKNSQITKINCEISSNNSNSNNNNNSNCNNNHNKQQNFKQINTNNINELTNAFANTTITTSATSKIATTTTTTTTINSDNSNNKQTSIKENTFQHIEQPQMQNTDLVNKTKSTPEIINENSTTTTTTSTTDPLNTTNELMNPEPYYQVPKSSEPYYDAPKHLKPVPVYENIEIFFNGNLTTELSNELPTNLQPPKEKPPPPPVDSPPLFDDVDSSSHTDTWSSDNTYETLSRHQLNHHNHHLSPDHPSPPIKRMNSTKRIKKELRNKRSSFLGIEGSSMDDDESYLELTVAPPPDMAQLLQEERRLEKQLYLKAGLCDSSDTGESRDSGVSENHSRQSSEHYTNSSEENETHDDTTSPLTLQTQTALDAPTPNDMIYQNDGLLTVVPTPLLQTVKGNSAESWTESATVAAAATQSLTEATATANAKMMSIEEKIREQEEVLRVERELLQLEQEELKRQRENLMLRENMARRELQHGAKMLMSANRRSLQDLNGLGNMTVVNIAGEGDMYHSQLGHNMPQHMLSQPQLAQPQQQTQQLPQQQFQSQQIYANIPNLQQQYYHMENDYRKSMSDINEFSKRMMSQPQPPAPPSKPMRAMHINTNTTTNGMLHNGQAEHTQDYAARQRHSLNSQNFGGSLVKIANAPPTAAPRGNPHIYSNYHHQSVQNLSTTNQNPTQVPNNGVNPSLYPGNMSRNTLHALSATPKPKYTDGWVQVQQRKSYDSNLANDPAWLSAYQQKRKSMPDTYHGYNQNNHWLVQEAEQRRLSEQQQQQRRAVSSNNTPIHQTVNINTKMTNSSTMSTSSTNGKPLPDSIIQTLTERVQSKGIGERKRTNLDKSPLHAASSYHQYQQQYNNKLNPQQQPTVSSTVIHRHTNNMISTTSSASTAAISSSTTTTSITQGQSNITTTQQQQQQQQDKVLSVSGKKKCSHCGDELDLGCTSDKCRHTHRELKYIVWV